MFDLDGKTAVVSGGGSGIGESISTALASVGVNVVIADINPGVSRDLCRRLEDKGFKASFMQVDVSDSQSVRALFENILQRFGGADIVVNNAGLLADSDILDISDEAWKRLLGVNLDGVFYCCREAVRQMRERNKGGRIINIASAGGKLGFPYAGVHYCASKGAVMALSRQLALQTAGDNITVNAVAPGTTQTGLIKNRTPETVRYIESHIPLGRMGLPRDTAAAVVLLASEHSGYITGETIDVNGGLYMD